MEILHKCAKYLLEGRVGLKYYLDCYSICQKRNANFCGVLHNNVVAGALVYNVLRYLSNFNRVKHGFFATATGRMNCLLGKH